MAIKVGSTVLLVKLVGNFESNITDHIGKRGVVTELIRDMRFDGGRLEDCAEVLFGNEHYYCSLRELELVENPHEPVDEEKEVLLSILPLLDTLRNHKNLQGKDDLQALIAELDEKIKKAHLDD